MAILAIFGKQGVNLAVVHKMCNYNIISQKLDILLIKMIPTSTCYTSGRGISLLFQPWPLALLHMAITVASTLMCVFLMLVRIN